MTIYVSPLPAGTRGYDAAFPPPPAACAADGGQFMSRYYAPVLSTNAKNLQPGEAIQWGLVGIAVSINGEWSAATMLQGTGPNTSLGNAVRQGCDRDGVPDDCPLWWSMDTQCDKPQYDSSRFAWDAYRATNPNNPFGIYGGSYYCEWAMDEGYADFAWIANAPYWSRLGSVGIPDRDGLADNITIFRFPHSGTFQFNYYISPRCHMRQVGGRSFGGGSVDDNITIHPTPFWFPLGLPDDPPALGASSMGQHLGYLQLTDDAGHDLAGVFGELMRGEDNRLYQDSVIGEGIGVYGFQLGRASQSAYNALPVYNADADANWLFSHAPRVDLSPVNTQLANIAAQITSVSQQIAGLQTVTSNGFSQTNNNVGVVGAGVAQANTTLGKVQTDLTSVKATVEAIKAELDAGGGGGGGCDLTPVLDAIETLSTELHGMVVQVNLAAAGTVK